LTPVGTALIGRNGYPITADRFVIRQDGRIVAEHSRSFGRGDTVSDPWHYVQFLARKPGALEKAKERRLTWEKPNEPIGPRISFF